MSIAAPEHLWKSLEGAITNGTSYNFSRRCTTPLGKVAFYLENGDEIDRVAARFWPTGSQDGTINDSTITVISLALTKTTLSVLNYLRAHDSIISWRPSKSFLDLSKTMDVWQHQTRTEIGAVTCILEEDLADPSFPGAMIVTIEELGLFWVIHDMSHPLRSIPTIRITRYALIGRAVRKEASYVHGCVVARNGRAALLTSPKFGGKTTALLKLLHKHDVDLVANDKSVVVLEDRRGIVENPVIYGIPLSIGVWQDVAAQYENLLQSVAGIRSLTVLPHASMRHYLDPYRTAAFFGRSVANSASIKVILHLCFERDSSSYCLRPKGLDSVIQSLMLPKISPQCSYWDQYAGVNSLHAISRRLQQCLGRVPTYGLKYGSRSFSEAMAIVSDFLS